MNKLGLLGLWVSVATAGINVNNGNFYIGYSDIDIPTPGVSLKLTRTYNSRSNYVRGYFGIGWSSDLDTYLRIENQKLFIHDGGGGAVQAFIKQGAGWVNPSAKLMTISQVKNKYVMSTAEGVKTTFDEKGRFLLREDRNGNKLELKYENNLPSVVQDGFNNQVRVVWKDFAGAPRIVTLDGGDKKARFDYAKNGALSKVVGQDGEPYEYEYDDEFNMTRISYMNGEFKKMGYNKVRDWVTSFRDNDGWTTEYNYTSDSVDPENRFGTVVTRYLESAKNKKSISKFWYEFKKRPDGSKYNSRILSLLDSQVTETLLTECCGTPLVISQWQVDKATSGAGDAWMVAPSSKKTTKFDYYADGLLKRKISADGRITDLTYDQAFRKVASVKVGNQQVEYNYDRKGNLVWAVDSQQNKRIDLAYDLKGRITSMVEKQKVAGSLIQEVLFRYGNDGKPVEVKRKDAKGRQGTVQFKYGKAGEMLGMFNAQGKPLQTDYEMELAQGVAGAFQNLMIMVQPAGVSLSPEG